MITQVKRHEIQVLLKARNTQTETVGIAKVSVQSV